VYAQSTLRYAANMTLDAHLPGNGMGGSTAEIETSVPTPSTIGVTACGVDQLSQTDADCQAEFTENCDAVDVGGVNEAQDIAGSPLGSFDFDFPLCCNIASNAPAGYAITTPLAIDDVIQPGAGWVDVNWLAAGLRQYAADGAGAVASANGNAYNANHGTTFPTLTGAAAAAGGPNFGGLNFDAFGVITQPASQCTNTRANAMGVGNSMALTTPTTSQQGQGDGAGGGTATDLATGVIQMDTATTRLVPYYIGQFGGAAGTTGGCKKMQAVQSFATDDPAEAAGTTAGGTEPMAAVSTAIDIIGGCGASMSDFASNHCTDGGNKDTGADNTAVVANTERVNPRIASVLGGQAVWNIIAGVQDQLANSADVDPDSFVQSNCAQNLDAMFFYNTGAIIKNPDGTTYEPANDAAKIAGDMPGAVSFPTWYVGIGEDSTGLGSTGFVVPNGFCYAKACLTEFLKVGTGNKGAGMGKLVKDPNMANPVTSSSKCGQAQSACADIGGYAAVTGNTGSTTLVGDGPTKWDGREWPVPSESYVASDTVGADAGTFIRPSSDTTGAGTISAFRGPVF